jgi:hypothetical protein
MCKLIEKDLKIDGIQLRELQKKALAGRGFDRAIYRDVLETLLHCSNGFYTAQRDASALYGQQAKAAFILAKYSDRARSRGW